jgi:hypothetical protein
MRKLMALALVAFALLGFAPAAQAGAGVDVALGLASFAVFSQLFGWYPRPDVERVVVYAPPPTYVTGPGVYPATSVTVYTPATPTVVEYPHGRYELRGDGMRVAYQWVWIPKVPPPPPPPPLAPPPALAPPTEPPTSIQGLN